MTKLNARTFSSLVYFEACGRLLSFSAAGKELCVTTGAISQQIRKLEEQLGFKLFDRQPSGIVLTQEGKEMLNVTQQSIESVEMVIRRLQAKLSDNVVRLKSTPSFVFKWLIPKLQEFNLEYPHIKVETYADEALLELAGADFDIAIDYGDGQYDGFTTNLLVKETLLPVMSPEYMKEADWKQAKTLEEASLLHDAMPWIDAEQDAEWRFWLDETRLVGIDSTQGHFFNRSYMAIAAAEAGLGIALARASQVGEELKNGRLIAPYKGVPSCRDYYMLIPKKGRANIHAYILKNWLLEHVDMKEDTTILNPSAK